MTASILIPPPSAAASELVEFQPLTERILMLHFNDGHVRHHQRGEPRSAEKVFTDPLEVVAASRPESYTVTSADDPAYLEKQTPLAIGRKSKGTDFAWFVDKWENGRAINTRPDHTKEHWLYLELPTAMQPHATLHPGIEAWPGNERWFSNRCSPMGSEFTIHQNIGPAAAIFGFLCADERK